MRIVLDLQGAQSASRFRGIGRYAMAVSQAIAREARGHDIWIMLNGRFVDTIEPIRRTFNDLIPSERIVVFEVPGPVAELDPTNAWRARAAELIREQTLADLQPDWVHVFSLFEGLVDDAVSSIASMGTTMPTSVTLYDLIPYLRPDPYLEDPRVRGWYLRKTKALKRAGLLLSISHSSRREAVETLSIPEERIVNIGAGVDSCFRPIILPADKKQTLVRRYGLTRPYVMYTGGFDHRKNLEGLIEAYVMLPGNIRSRHQLAIVGKIQQADQDRIMRLAKSRALERDEIIFTDYVPDEDLVSLYNTCTLFVFPSLHEGFGLPALEAMASGAPVIGSNCTSIPEVIGRDDALFDPTRPADMAQKMAQALSDGDFRQDLAAHGLLQAKKFSWEASARTALNAFEAAHQRQLDEIRSNLFVSVTHRLPRLAYVSPLPPESTFVADYSAELLPELSRFYDIEVVVHQPQVTDPWVLANFPVHDVVWFENNAARFDRILYHLGNSPFHAHMFDLLERHPGVVVLHEFFLSGVRHWMETTGYAPGALRKALYYAHGYPSLAALQRQGLEAVLWAYPCNRDVLDLATGVIVQAEHSFRLAERWYGQGGSDGWRCIPQLHVISNTMDRKIARARLGFASHDFLVCSFGMVGPMGLGDRVLHAWLQSFLGQNERCHLVFVGDKEDGDFGRELAESIHDSGLASRIRITSFADLGMYKDYLAAADMAVQLRVRSRGETSQTILDCLAYGLPVIVNEHGSNTDYPDDILIMIEDAFSDEDLTEVFERLYLDSELRASLSHRAVAYVQKHHHPAHIGKLYRNALEHFAASPRKREQELIRALAELEAPVLPSDADVLSVSAAIAANQPRTSPRQLLVDISEIVQRDSKTGIQRVVRALLQTFLDQPFQGYRIEPVYLYGGYYVYARHFMLNMLGLPEEGLEDTPIAVHAGDVFLGLDLVAHLITRHESLYHDLQARGVRIVFVVYDLLPILRPDVFPEFLQPQFASWLDVIARLSDGLICISRAVADELTAWLMVHPPSRLRALNIGYFRLGADLSVSLPTKGLPEDASVTLQALSARPALLMVGTIEPRKGYAQSLAACELLWGKGVEVSLVIVGKQGWMVDSLVERLRHHPELDKRLFWLEGISDEYLEKVYASSSVLLAASEGEGFGLPLIEAAQHHLPIIARDIPVFREVVGEHAFYFRGTAPEVLAEAIETWLTLHAEDRSPGSVGVPWVTWQESAQQLLDVIVKDLWHSRWQPRVADPPSKESLS